MMALGARAQGRLAALVVCATLIAACQPGSSSEAASPTLPAATASTAPGPTDAPLPPTDPIEGVVIHVDSTGLNSVTGFTLRAIDGKTYQFVVGRLQNAAQFPPGHLAEHQVNAVPILVSFQAFGPQIFAIRLDDATPSASSPSVTPAPSRPPAPTETPSAS